jgi:hypothetical protein
MHIRLRGWYGGKDELRRETGTEEQVLGASVLGLDWQRRPKMCATPYGDHHKDSLYAELWLSDWMEEILLLEWSDVQFL